MSSAASSASSKGGDIIGNDTTPSTPVWVWVILVVVTLGIALFYLKRK